MRSASQYLIYTLIFLVWRRIHLPL